MARAPARRRRRRGLARLSRAIPYGDVGAVRIKELKDIPDK